jgi:CheY-like chemotaxis protein
LDADTALSGIEPGVSDLIIVDLHLGNYSINGLDLTRLLRERGITEPIVAVTSYDHLYAAYYQDAGCDAYLKKPISVGNMLDLIDRFRP